MLACLNLSVVSKIHFLPNETKVFVVHGLKWHYKLHHLFCAALYNNWKSKKRACPLEWKNSASTLILKITGNAEAHPIEAPIYGFTLRVDF
jgi:hypothetical protein